MAVTTKKTGMSDTAIKTPYQVCEEGLRRLHELDEKDLLDSPEADDVRDRMDGPWYDLTDSEQDQLNRLSAELHLVRDQAGGEKDA